MDRRTHVIFPLQLFGVLLNWCLYGALVVQLCERRFVFRNTYQAVYRSIDVYSYNFPEDKKLLKLLGMQTVPLPSLLSPTDGSCIVYGIFFIETLQTALSGADVYYWFVSGFGDITHLNTPYATPFDVPMIEALVSFSVQCFFAYRIWVLSLKTSWWLCTSICLVSPPQMCNCSILFFVVVCPY